MLKKILKSNPLNFCSQLVKILEYVLKNDYFPPPILLEQSSTRWKQEVWLKEEFDDFSFLSAFILCTKLAQYDTYVTIFRFFFLSVPWKVPARFRRYLARM